MSRIDGRSQTRKRENEIFSLSLTQVELYFGFCQVSDTGVQALAQALQGLVHLTRVELDFLGCEVSDTGVQALAQALQGLVQLTKVIYCRSE